MQSKTQRIVGMALFSAAGIFLFWHVDYIYLTDNFYSSNVVDYVRLHFVGFNDNPLGYGSIAYRVIAKFVDTSWRYTAINNAWVLTQSIPILISWGIRGFLGRSVRAVELLVRKLYSSV
jgi:hypothetical protein